MVLTFFFVLFAVTAIVSAFLVITRRSPIYSALFLALTLAAQAGLFTLLGAFFIGVIQILIYAGAIMILFLFVILSLDPTESLGVLRSPVVRVASGFAVVVLVVQLVLAIRRSAIAWKPVTLSTGEGAEEYVAALGKDIFTTYLVPFEIGSVLLLVAVLGAVVLAQKKRKDE